MWNPFSSKKDCIPTEEEISKGVFNENVDVQEITRNIQNWAISAYHAGERAAEEGENKTDTTKLAGVGAVGFMVAFILIKMKLIPV